MTTKTKPALPTVDQATADLLAAEDKLRDTRAAVIAGDTKVSPSDVADAQDDIEHAKLRMELARNADGARAEQARTARIADLVAALTTGEVAAKARTVVDLEAKAAAAIEALHLAARDYRDSARSAANELGRIGDLPPRVEVEHLNHQPGQVRIDGLAVEGTRNHGDWPGTVLLGAIYRALHPHIPNLSDKSGSLYDMASRVVAGGIGQPKLTAGDLLAQQTDRLGRTPSR